MPSLPIVLAHGYLGFGALGPLNYFNNVASILRSAGATQVFAPDVAPKGTLQARSAQLAQQINAQFNNQKVHVIAHSMGGLDARFLIARGATNIASLTALGTPFRGTLAADVVVDPARLLQVNSAQLLATIGRYQIAVAATWPFEVEATTHFAIGQLNAAVGDLDHRDYSGLATYFSSLFSLDDGALSELTTEKCLQNFPTDQSDLRGVPTFSYAGSMAPAQVTPVITVPAILLSSTGQQNDGVVPLASAMLRNHMATLPVDHFGLVGWTPTDVSDCYRQIYATINALPAEYKGMRGRCPSSRSIGSRILPPKRTGAHRGGAVTGRRW
jgi:pimeloyl-ACP methyl ester carboxylesterase